MPVTLRSMLSASPLAEADPVVLSADENLDRPVRWVHVVEVYDAGEVLAGHELVLTTGVPLAGPDADPDGFLTQLAEAESCGLVVELGTRMPSIPTSLIATAERLNLPIVALQRPIRFVAVTEVVHRLIVGEQYRGLEFSKRTHEVFTSLALDSADAPTIVTETAGLVGAPVVLEDLRHRVLALAAAGVDTQDVLAQWEEKSRRAPSLDEVGIAGADGWLTCPVGLRGASWGRVVMPRPGDDLERDSMVLQRAAQALQISRLVERDRAGLHTEAQESLLQALVEGRIHDEVEAVTRARALGVRSAAMFVPVVVMFAKGPVGDELTRHRRARSHIRAVARIIGRSRHQGIVGALSPEAVGLIVPIASRNEDRVLREIAAALAEAEGTRAEGGPVMGVGAPSPSLLTAAATLRPTLHVADAARVLPSSDLAYHRSTDVRLQGLIAQLRDDERLQAFAESELGSVLSTPDPQRSETLVLLRSYVRNLGNKAAIAAEIGISRPALYARLHKTERLLEIDLDDSNSFLSLGVALLTLDSRLDVPHGHGPRQAG